MLVLDKNVELIKCLKDLERIIYTTPKRVLSCACAQVRPKIKYIFENLIDINTVDIDALMKLIDNHKFHYKVKSFIMAELVFMYDNIDEYHGNVKRQRLVEKHVFKIIT